MAQGTLPREVFVRDLKLADKVRVLLPDHPYNTATVTNIEPPSNELPSGRITLFRVYVHTSNFSYTGGVIPYIGTETIVFYADSTTKIWLLEEGGPIK